MKMSFHAERVDVSGRHNDRNFDLSKVVDQHIDPERSKDNKYWRIEGTEGLTFRDGELKFYKEHFKDYLDRKNENQKKWNHYSRIKSMEDYHKSRNTRPQDLIIQVGNTEDGTISPEELWQIAMEYKEEFEKKFGDKCKILNMAMHVDELKVDPVTNRPVEPKEYTTPHIHIRRVWVMQDELGNERVNQTDAVESIGFPAPNPDQPEGKYNNAMQEFTAADREIAFNICKAHGLQMERGEMGSSARHLSREEYKAKKAAEVTKERERENRRLNAENKRLENEKKELLKAVNGIDDDIEDILTKLIMSGYLDRKELEEKTRQEKIQAIEEAMEKLKQQATDENELIANSVRAELQSKIDALMEKLEAAQKENEKLMAFIKDEGLLDKYEENVKEKKQEKKNREETGIPFVNYL